MLFYCPPNQNAFCIALSSHHSTEVLFPSETSVYPSTTEMVSNETGFPKGHTQTCTLGGWYLAGKILLWYIKCSKIFIISHCCKISLLVSSRTVPFLHLYFILWGQYIMKPFNFFSSRITIKCTHSANTSSHPTFPRAVNLFSSSFSLCSRVNHRFLQLPFVVWLGNCEKCSSCIFFPNVRDSFGLWGLPEQLQLKALICGFSSSSSSFLLGFNVELYMSCCLWSIFSILDSLLCLPYSWCCSTILIFILNGITSAISNYFIKSHFVDSQ